MQNLDVRDDYRASFWTVHDMRNRSMTKLIQLAGNEGYFDEFVWFLTESFREWMMLIISFPNY